MTTEPDAYSRAKIEKLSEELLRRGGLDLGRFPTNLAALEPVLELGPAVDLSEIVVSKPSRRDRVKEFVTKLTAPAKRVLGATFFPSHIVVVDFSLAEVRARWTHGHELGHVLLPWHDTDTYLDDDATLSPTTRIRREREANLVAEHLLYQGSRAMPFALDHEHGIAAALLLADHTKTSIHASLRHYVEHHPDPVALVVAGRYERANGRPVFATHASPSFRADFGTPLDHIPPGAARDQIPAGANWARELVVASTIENLPQQALMLASGTGRAHPFRAEAFFNQHLHFLMLTAHRRRISRRVQIATASA